MKLVTRIIAVLACTSALWACQTEPTTDHMVEGGATTLTISLEPSRTSLGEKSGESYPVYWSEGDRIAINGVAHEAAIDASNRSVATFEVTSIATPYNITYPYLEALAGASSKVVFPAEQSYVEGTFAPGSTPMCGYVASGSKEVKLKHLACLLRFPVKASTEGIVLDKVVITSSIANIAGEFVVDCSQAKISPSENTANSITYTLPENFTLSTDTESVFYISIPAIEVGNCSVEFIESSGNKMVSTWKGTNIKSGVVREFKSITYKRGTSGALTLWRLKRTPSQSTTLQFLATLRIPTEILFRALPYRMALRWLQPTRMVTTRWM